MTPTLDTLADQLTGRVLDECAASNWEKVVVAVGLGDLTGPAARPLEYEHSRQGLRGGRPRGKVNAMTRPFTGQARSAERQRAVAHLRAAQADHVEQVVVRHLPVATVTGLR